MAQQLLLPGGTPLAEQEEQAVLQHLLLLQVQQIQAANQEQRGWAANRQTGA